jgi:hypothetical protein
MVNEKHPYLESPVDPGTAAAERIVEHLERSGYQVREGRKRLAGGRRSDDTGNYLRVEATFRVHLRTPNGHNFEADTYEAGVAP